MDCKKILNSQKICILLHFFKLALTKLIIMERKKIITVCGSLKFKEKIMREAIRLELEGNIVLTPLFPLKEEDMPTKEEGNLLGNMHKEKIKISDGIFVINVGGYIGESTQSEISLAKSLHKEVKYLEEI